MKKVVICLGTGRCGTLSMSKLLKNFMVLLNELDVEDVMAKQSGLLNVNRLFAIHAMSVRKKQ